ncbi:MAG: hypothetical protein K2O24_09200, partial [Muribaculaceae bacterium]|nr:hypothetical protein [Muribaculaceae bacterium]
KSSWVNKLGLAATTYPAWTYYFECMIDDDQLQEDLALGKKVPYDLFNMLRFLDSCDFSKVEGWQEIWKKNAYKYMSLESAMAYTAFTDYLAAVDQRAKNMQPMFFLEDGCSVENGVYSGAKGMEPTRMYLNKIYDCDTCNGADNDGGRDIDAEVDPNKPTNEAEGYTNPYMGSGSVLFNNIDKQPECWNSNDNGSTTISLKSVINKMRNQTGEIAGKTMVPFSPDGALYFFVTSKLMFWPKVISSYDGERKYIDNTNIANMPYFYALHGLGLTSLPRFIEQRWAIRDGYYQTGDFFTNPLSGRVSAINANSKIYITAAATGYFGIGNDASGQLSESIFLEAGESYAFTTFAHDEGALLYIYQPGRMSRIDLSEMTLAFHFNDLSKLELAEEITLGGEKHTANTSLNGFNPLSSLVLGNLPFLRILDVSKTSVNSIDAKGCPRMESVIADDTPLTACSIAQTAPLETLALPATMTSLELVNLPSLTYPGGLSLAGMGSVNRLWVEGCPGIDTQGFVMAVCEAGAIRQVRIPDVDMTAGVDVLRRLRQTGATGMDAAGNAYEERGKCSGIAGRWILSELIADKDADGVAGMNTLAAYFPELELMNAQFSMVSYCDAEDDCENISNYDNRTGYLFGKPFVASGHFLRLYERSHAYRGTYDAAQEVMHCRRLSDTDYNFMADGTGVDLTDSSDMGCDFFKHLPAHWYKGVNDFKNQVKYSLRSTTEHEPLSTARRTLRHLLGELQVTKGMSLVMSANSVGTEPVMTADTGMDVYRVDVEGMRQVRWYGVNSGTLGCVFLDGTGRIVSMFRMGVEHGEFDFIAGEDYIFTDVPQGARSFLFTARSGLSADLEVVTTDSASVEAIEPDWVRCRDSLVGIYAMSCDGRRRARSVSGKKASTGTNTHATSGVWTYDEDGNVVPAAPPGLNFTVLDCLNLCASRGKGYHAVSYEQSKDISNLMMELLGTRDMQASCGYGDAWSYTTGTQTISGYYFNGEDTPVSRKINAHGNRTVLNSSTAGGNLIFGIQQWIGCAGEWMGGVVVNASSYGEFMRDRYPETKSTYPLEARWRIYDYATGRERSVQGIDNTSTSNNTVARVRHGRYMDTIAGAMTGDTSLRSTHYTDIQDYSHERCRMVARGGSNHYVTAGGVYSNARNNASFSFANYGSRLAFSGRIVFDD